MSWVSVVELIQMACSASLMFILINSVLRPRRNFWWMLGYVIFNTLAPQPLRHFGMPDALRLPIGILLSLVPILILYPREGILRAIYVGIGILVTDLIGSAFASVFIVAVTEQFFVNLNAVKQPIELAGVLIEIPIALALLAIMLRPLRHEKRMASKRWMGFVQFMVSQYLLYYTFVILLFSAGKPAMALMYVLIACTIVCVGADILLYGTIKRARYAAQTMAENDALRTAQALLTAHNRSVQDQLAQIAIERHDFSNHLNTLALLFFQDADAAAAYLDRLITDHERND